MKINLNNGQGTLIFGDTVTLSRHFVLKLKAYIYAKKSSAVHFTILGNIF
jgi:hypothetical protein